jgi:hypothetical protein
VNQHCSGKNIFYSHEQRLIHQYRQILFSGTIFLLQSIRFYYLPIQNFKTLTSKDFQGRGTNEVQE